jgi:hypothetical protein
MIVQIRTKNLLNKSKIKKNYFNKMKIKLININ